MSPKIVSQEEWLATRNVLLEKEKAHDRASDDLAVELRNLPMVKLNKEYALVGPDGPTTLADLFAGKNQLIVYHFMFDPAADIGCKGCSFVADHIPDLRHLRSKDTAFACVSRAPFDKLEAFKQKVGWEFPWYSSGDGDFNYDFLATNDELRSRAGVKSLFGQVTRPTGKNPAGGDQPGFSVFWQEGGDVYYTYSTYGGRDLRLFMPTLCLLNMTPLGPQEGPMGPAEFKLKYEYEEGA